MIDRINRILKTVACLYLICKHEYPSDPTAASNRLLAPLLGYQAVPIYGYDLSQGLSNPIVSTNLGKLEGYQMKSIKGRPIFAFEGIPYGETTGGSNRFKPVIPKAPWHGVRSVKKPGAACLQVHIMRFSRIIGDEDCLFMNIYVPAEPILKSSANLPVILTIHGGSWIFGAGSDYGPAYLLEHDVILVTINYRLGILGYLSTGDEHLPGNLGQKDQREAMKWVHENIVHFGGDPKRVTINGQSGGGSCVHFHMLSQPSYPYFSGAISMSGTAFNNWAIQSNRVIKLRNQQLAKATKCPLTSSQEFVECLRKMNGRRLEFGRGIPAIVLGVVIEEDRPGAFLTAHPDDIYDRGGAAKVPFMISGTAEEFAISIDIVERLQRLYNLVSPGASYKTLSRVKAILPFLLDYDHIDQNLSIITEKIMDFYFKQNGQYRYRVGNLTAIGQLAADRLMGYAVHKATQRHSQVAPTYASVYNYHGRGTIASEYFGFDPKKIGVAHTEDVSMIFNITEFVTGYKTTDPEYTVVKLMTSTWYNFAAKGEPLYTDDDGNDLRIWSPISDPKHIEVLEISNNGVKMIPEPYTHRFKFWDTVGIPDIRPFIPLD